MFHTLSIWLLVAAFFGAGVVNAISSQALSAGATLRGGGD